jgi:hypothetical protein
MPHSSPWATIGGVAAILVLLLALFFEIPRLRRRFSEAELGPALLVPSLLVLLAKVATAIWAVILLLARNGYYPQGRDGPLEPGPDPALYLDLMPFLLVIYGVSVLLHFPLCWADKDSPLGLRWTFHTYFTLFLANLAL